MGSKRIPDYVGSPNTAIAGIRMNAKLALRGTLAATRRSLRELVALMIAEVWLPTAANSTIHGSQSPLEGWGSVDPQRPAANQLVGRVEELDVAVDSQREALGELIEWVAAYRSVLVQVSEPGGRGRR